VTLKVADLRPCPNCASKLEPVSLCTTCGSVSVRSDLKEVDRRTPCAECRASNPTVFVCEKCNGRFLFEEVTAPEKEKFACALCGTFVEPDAKDCPACGAEFTEEKPLRIAPRPPRPKRRVRSEYSDADLDDIARIPGVGREKAEALCRAGFNALWKIKRAAEADLARVAGIGPRGARTVKDSLRFILLLPRRKTKEEVLEEEYACPLCGAVTSLFSRECRDCGARFDEEELEEDLRKEVDREVDKGLLAFYDVHLEETPKDPDLLYARALLLYDMGKLEEAQRSIDAACASDPASRRALLVRSRILASFFDFPQAAAGLKGVLSTLLPGGEARPAASEEEAKAASAALEALTSLQERECPTCGELVLPDAQVCPACGHRLEPEARPAPAPEGPAADLEAPPPEAPSGFAALEELERLMDIPPPATPPEPEAKPEPEAETRPSAAPKARPPSRPAGPSEETRRRGMTNGLGRVDVRSPSVRFRRGLINGHGLINGSGRVNGLINGTGFVDASVLTEFRLTRQPFLMRYALVAGSMLMAFVLAASLLSPGPGPPSGIAIDGNPGDWAGVPTYADPSPASDPNVAIARYGVALEGTRLSILVQVSGQALGDAAGYDAFYAFIDADGSAATGYGAGGLGADYVAEVYGGSGQVASGRLYEFPANSELNWSRRTAIGGVQAAASGATLELRVDTDLFASFSPTATTILVASDDFEGSSARAGIAVAATHGAIRIRQVPLLSVLPSGTTAALRLDVAAVGELGPQDSWTVGSFVLGSTAGVTASPSPAQVTLTQAVRSASVTVSVSASGLSAGTPVQVSLQSAQAPRTVTVAGEGLAAYFASIPPAIRIDGLFVDWAARAVRDSDPTAIPRASLDIDEYGGAANASGTFFHLRLSGRALEGSLVPQKIPRLPPGGGGGGGPPAAPPPRATGEDVARVYIDANGSANTGLQVAGLYADYMVEVRGSNGRIARQDAYRWQSGWVPDVGLGLQVAKNATALEGSLGLNPAELNGTLMAFETSDWGGQGDATAVLSTRGGAPRGTRSDSNPPGLPLHGASGQTAIAKPLSGFPAVDGDCSDTVYADAGTFSSNGIDGRVGTYNFFVYVCVEATLDTSSNGSADFARIYFDRDHDGGSGPTPGDRRFAVASGSAVNESMRGNNQATAWETCPANSNPTGIQCHADNQGIGAFSTHQFYEFKVEYRDVWNTTTPSPSSPSGFAIIVTDGNATNPATYRWGSSSPPGDLTPDTWGHLEIPEFRDIVVPTVGLIVLLVTLRRRRVRGVPASTRLSP